MTNARSRPSERAASVASARVGPIRLDRISRLRSGVNRPPIETPARWMTASTPASSSGSGSSGRHWRSPSLARGPPDQPDDPVAAGAEQRRQRRADGPAGAGERDRQRLGAHLPGPRVRGQVRRELPVPVAEHRPQRPRRDRRGDDVGHPGAPGHGLEPMGVPPAQRGPERPLQLVGELAGRVVGVRVMAGHPAQPARQREHRLAVADRRCLPRHAHRLPGRHQARDGPGSGVPGKHLVRVRMHHTRVRETQCPSVRLLRSATCNQY